MAHNTKSNPAPPKIQQRFTPSGRHGRRQERAWYSANRYFPDPLGSIHCADLNIFTGMAGGKRGGVLFIKGQEPIKVEDNLADELIRVARKIAAEKMG